MTENNNETQKTFEDFGLTFQPNKECITCNTGSCHNNVTSRIDGKDYNVHMTVDYDTKEFYVIASENASSEPSFDMFEVFKKEQDAVKFVCDRNVRQYRI